jgi:hypothetical protein
MTTEQAFTQGFLKRAAQHGISEADAMKLAGLKTEMAGSLLNPLSGIGSVVGGIAAAATKTRTDEEQDKAHKESWKNMLIPGRSTYNAFKRMGHSAKGSKDRERAKADGKKDTK